MLERDYSHIIEVKKLNYTQDNYAHNMPGIHNMKRFISALEETREPIFKIRSTRFPLSLGTIKDEWMALKRNGWTISRSYDSSMGRGIVEVYICKKIEVKGDSEQ